MDIFLSYHSPDLQWTEALAYRLRDHGLEVWFDKWEIRHGDPHVEKMREGIESSGTMIAVYSETDSPWQHAEVDAAYNRIKEQEYGDDEPHQRLIPLKRNDAVPLDPFVAALSPISFKGAEPESDEFERHLKSLLASIDPDRFQVPREGHLSVPIVVAALVDSEAEQLFENEAFIEFFENFEALVALDSDEEEDIKCRVLSRYRGTRERWLPFREEGELTIGEVLDEIFDYANRKSQERDSSAPMLIPEPWTTSLFLNPDTAQLDAETAEDLQKRAKDHRRRTAKYLRHRGCILILDPLALFNDFVVQVLKDSELSSQKTVTVICTSPINFRLFAPVRAVDEEIREKFQPLADRFEDLDPLSHFGLDDKVSLHYWMQTHLPLAIERLESSVPEVRRLRKVREILGSEESTSDLASLLQGRAHAG